MSGSRENPAPPDDATGEFQRDDGEPCPGSRTVSSAPDVTCDFQPDDVAGTVAPAGETCDFQADPSRAERGSVRPPRLNPAAFDATGEFGRVQTGGPRTDASGPTQPLDETCDQPAGAPAGNATADFVLNDNSAPSVQPTFRRGEAGRHTQAAGGRPAAPAAPDRLGRYALKKFHARGGMGEIWLADDEGIGRAVALKKMRTGRPEHREQFVREAQVTGQLEHPGIVPVHELGAGDDGQPYYVMKFVHGRTLKDVIEEYHDPQRGRGAAREVGRLKLLNSFLALCQTIAYAHSRDVIHRDIKPDNVMVGPYGETLVLDWGLAKVVGEADIPSGTSSVRLSASGDSLHTLDGTVKGTPSYMAPEMAEGIAGEVDQASDVYLLGATLYHILTGKAPRQAKKLAELMELARTQEPTPPRQLDPAVPKPLDAICRKALARRKADRYPTATALAEDVQRFLAGEPVTAYRETAWERAWRWARRHRTALTRTAAALLVAAAATAAALAFRESERRRAEAQQTADELARQETARGQVATFRRLADEARFFAASADPADEKAPFFDVKKGEARGQEALAVADAWGPALADLPLGDEQRAALAHELYDLLLLLAQVKGRRAEPDDARAALALLDRAATLGEPTRGLYRLRAESRARTGDGGAAEADRRRADDSRTQARAFDYFLDGERLRAEAARLTLASPDAKAKSPKVATLERAADAYRAALRLDPKDYWSHYQLGRTYQSLGRRAEAVEVLGACIALRPDVPWAYSARGSALAGLQRFPEAFADLERAIQLDPDSRAARFNWATARWQQKKEQKDSDLADVQAVLEAVLAPPEDTRLVEAYFLRGQIALSRGEFDVALEDFDRVLADKVDYPVLHLHRARIFLVQGKAEKALESLDGFLAAGGGYDPHSPEAFARRAHELRALATEFPPKQRRDKLLLAKAQLDEAVKRGGRSVLVYDELGGTLETLGDISPAVAAYTKAVEADAKNARLLVKRGWAREKLTPPDYAGARADFAAAAALEPEDAEAHSGLGYIEACLKKSGPAQRHANLALLHGAGDYLILHNVACIFATLSRTDAGRAAEFQDLALDQLQREVALWKKGGAGPDPVRLIQREPALPPALRARPEFKRLIAP